MQHVRRSRCSSRDVAWRDAACSHLLSVWRCGEAPEAPDYRNGAAMTEAGERLVQAAKEASEIAKDSLIAQIKADREKGTSPEYGEWIWHGQPDHLSLATACGGRRYVMDFVRKGMRGAQPRFQTDGIMRNAADELAEFVVGDPAARGSIQAKSDASVYRYDIKAIDHPDARRIARVPEYEARILEDADKLAALEAENASYKGTLERQLQITADAHSEADRLLAENAKLREALSEMMDVLHAEGGWDDNCFYYNGVSASELEGAIVMARAALTQETSDESA